MEDRKRELQCAQEQGLSPGAQLRAREGAPRGAAGVLQSRGVCNPHRLRPRLRRLAARPRDAWTPNPLLPQPASPEHLCCVLLLDRASWTELLETLAFARPPPRPPG